MSTNSNSNELVTSVVTIDNAGIPKAIDYDTRVAMLTVEEKNSLSALTESIDAHDMSTVHAIGSDLSQAVSTSSRKILDAAKKQTINSDSINMANELLATLNDIDLGEMNTSSKMKRFLKKIPLIGRAVTTVSTAVVKWDTDTKGKVDTIKEKFQAGKLIAQADNTTLQEMRDQSIIYLQRLRQLIMALKVKENELKEKLADMEANSQNYEFYEIQDMADCIHAIDKKIIDLEVNEDILTKGCYQIRAIQTNNTAIVDNYNNMCDNLIPIWEHQMALAINIHHQKQNLEVQKLYKEKMNEILQQNAEDLKINSIEAARASEESMIDIETVRDTTNKLIETVQAVNKIYEEGEKNRKAYEKEIATFQKKLEDSTKGRR